MSRPKYYWYGNVKRMVMRYEQLKGEKSTMAKKYTKAIEQAMDDIISLDNGKDRAKAIDMIYIQKSHTVTGAALELHYGERTIVRWLNNFIKTVGRNVGF